MSGAPTPVPIAVNFNVEIDASGNLNVFNAAQPIVQNVIVAECTLPVTSLYDETNNAGLIELWEPSNSQGDIHVQLADTNRSSEGGLDLTEQYQLSAKAIASGLQAILCDSFDCSGASPFNTYTNNVEYYKQRDFGRVALATYAHYLFGHVDATAAITNDKAFVEGMLSISAAGDDETATGAAARAAAWTKDTTANVQSWDISSNGTDANLAIRLVKAILQKGLSDTSSTATPIVSSINANNSNSLANIVAQVVGQDASRLMNADNSERTRDQHILLRFYAGDVIYMNIRLRAPAVNVGATNQQVLGTTLENMYSEENFTIKITLGATNDYTWTVITSGPGAKAYTDVSCSADGSVIAVSAFNFMMVYNPTTSSWVKPALAFRNWNTISVSSDGSLILAAATTGGTNSALVTRSTDYGSTWSTVLDNNSSWSSVNYSPTGNTYAVATRSGTTGTRTIYKSSDGGATWNELVDSGSRVWTSATISDDGQRIAACVAGTTGTDRFVYTSEDGGATWTQRDPSGTSTPLRFIGITGSSDGLKLAVVVIDGYIYTSADGGATWTQRDPAGGVRSWGSITSSPDGVYLTATITNGSIWTSTDSGVTWTERTFPTTYDWRACCMTSNGQKIYAAPFIAYPTGQNFLQESTNGGSTWIQVDQPGNGGYGITTTGTTRFATSSNGNTFMLTTGSVVYTSTDAGSTFVRRNLPLTVGTSPNVQFLNNITCDATGQIIYVAPAGLVSGVIQKSVDGGANWTGLTASGSRNWSFIRCSSNGQYIYGAIGSGNSTIYISTDSGNTFTSVVLPTTGASIRGIECDTTGQTVYVTISNTTLFKSTNYGATWSSASTLVAIGAAIDCNSTGSSILARNTSTSVTDYLYISTDSGATFNPITSAGQKLWSAASISGDGTRLVAATSAVINASNVVTSPGSVWVSKDSGATWEEQTSIPTNERWSGLQISSDGSKIYASGVSMQMYKASV